MPPSVAYEHVQLVAKVFPLAEQVEQVIDIAERFWEQHPDDYIAIHCAYGELSGWLSHVDLVLCMGVTSQNKAGKAVKEPACAEWLQQSDM